LEDVGEKWGIILKLIFMEEDWDMESNDSDQNGNEWPAVVYMVMNF
jgi:hypothetical protein